MRLHTVSHHEDELQDEEMEFYVGDRDGFIDEVDDEHGEAEAIPPWRQPPQRIMHPTPKTLGGAAPRRPREPAPLEPRQPREPPPLRGSVSATVGPPRPPAEPPSDAVILESEIAERQAELHARLDRRLEVGANTARGGWCVIMMDSGT